MTDSLATLQQLVINLRDDRNWKQFHKPKDLAAALAIEAGELQELFLWKDHDQIERLLDQHEQREKIEDEMADVLAYLLALADITQTDLGKALEHKMRKNARKYPIDKVKGDARKYNEY
jgi:NTP pyrophosphatase (non-canonical NTP hydrolase)